MRKAKIFSGSSHPILTEAICDRLGTQPANCELTKFSNGETSVSISTSVRDEDVFIVQSGSSQINDSVMELLIMISACKGGSARSITAVMPYFPYSRQSKKKSHRGAITARMLTNLLNVAGVQHVITVDLHAPPMQGFFRKPVDDLHAEPLIARWIRAHVPNWKESVVVSKNTGGTKRVTSLADVLKVNFALVTTDRRRTPMYGSGIFDASEIFEPAGEGAMLTGLNLAGQIESELQNGISRELEDPRQHSRASRSIRSRNNGTANAQPASHRHAGGPPGASPLVQSTRVDSESPPVSRSSRRQDSTGPNSSRTRETSDTAEEFTDERAREVVTGRLVQGHIVDDDFPSPILSTMSSSIATLPADQIEPSQYEERDLMTSSFVSTTSSVAPDHALGGTGDATATSDEEEEVFKNPDLEHTITLVGNVKNRTVLIMDDMIDKAGSWIAAAETVVKRGDAKKVYCIATHGLFGDDSLERMEDCQCIDSIVVTNSFPIASDKIKASKKLVVLDLSHLLSEAIRRNHHGESISQLYQHYQD